MSRLLSRVHPTFVCLIVILLALPTPVHAYAVLAHEAIIDAAWETHIRPLLVNKFPQATEEDLSRAQAYAYGGAIIQDMGYYPYGSPFFSDLTHYIRSGDFIQALLRDAKDINEYAFALGALAHSHPPAIAVENAVLDGRLCAANGVAFEGDFEPLESRRDIHQIFSMKRIAE